MGSGVGRGAWQVCSAREGPHPPHHMTQQGACPRATKATKQPCAEAAVIPGAGRSGFLPRLGVTPLSLSYCTPPSPHISLLGPP